MTRYALPMGQMITFPSNGSSAGGYLAIPSSGMGAGVVLIQEWWGLVPHITGVADRLAEAGFATLAPDLYHGEETTEPDEAGKLMMALQLPTAAREMVGAVDYMSRLDTHPSDRVGVVGFCMGGGLALWLSTLSSRVAACVPFYGAVPWQAVQPDYSKSVAAYLGHYAAHDDWATPEEAARLETELTALGREARFHVYPGTAHAFFNDDRPDSYDAAAAELAWERTIGFLRRHLG